ncbi:angiopoietin-4-like [Megalops cyprinoides]|uniref:angiopoietin-4-like n=1 Tax=Megalops cyprinoides TaxID=118141 RepID=UPI0018643763|nr:angiopoietin-4-like [Megalops cyprinoides]
MGRTGYGWFVLLLYPCILTGQAESRKTTAPHGTDCTQIKALSPGARSGLYTIKPMGVRRPFKVYCEMLADGGWTVFQRRTGGEVSFRRNWAAYKHGFGKPRGDHWLGLERVWALTQARGRRWTLRVDLWDFEGGTAFAEYEDFKLGNETEAYRLSVGTYRGTAGDAIRGAYPGIDQNGHGFSTEDRDNDGCSPCIFGDIAENECSWSEGGGGWWYSRCGSASLHGDWHPAGDNLGWASGLHWLTWKGPAPYSAQATRMMVKAV